MAAPDAAVLLVLSTGLTYVIITAGIDGIYPKGIPVGVVLKAQQGPNLFKNIEVRPSVDFGTIEEVIVIHTRKIPSEVVRYAP